MVLVNVDSSIDTGIGGDDGRILLCMGRKVSSIGHTVGTCGRCPLPPRRLLPQSISIRLLPILSSRGTGNWPVSSVLGKVDVSFHNSRLRFAAHSVIQICELNLKPLYLIALLQTLHGEKCIVFTSSVESTHRLCALLKFFGDLQIKIKEYSGVQRQAVRSKTLKAFRAGEIQVLVSSDAMTRGMDVEGIRNVINYDTPAYIKTYIHRAGRTARAGQAGRCFTLLHKDEVKRFKKILQKADNNSCSVHSVPSDLIESLHPVYTSALEKLKKSIESETYNKRKIRIKSSHRGNRK